MSVQYLVDAPLRFLLGFGTVTQYVGYSALTDFFPTMTMRPNPHCQNSHCRQRQLEAQVSMGPRQRSVHVPTVGRSDRPNRCVCVCVCVCRPGSKRRPHSRARRHSGRRVWRWSMRTTSGVCCFQCCHDNQCSLDTSTGISVVDASAEEQESSLEVAAGLHLAYSPPSSSQEAPAQEEEVSVQLYGGWSRLLVCVCSWLCVLPSVVGGRPASRTSWSS